MALMMDPMRTCYAWYYIEICEAQSQDSVQPYLQLAVYKKLTQGNIPQKSARYSICNMFFFLVSKID